MSMELSCVSGDGLFSSATAIVFLREWGNGQIMPSFFKNSFVLAKRTPASVLKPA
jgi:hypothetical protein